MGKTVNSSDPSVKAGDLREIGSSACWSVSTAKPGNDVELLRDGKIDTFWQSDGPQPHLVNIQFQRRLSVQEIHLYLDYTLDESYSPNRIAVRAGNSFNDLKDIVQMNFKEPQGWIVVPLKLNGAKKFIKASLLQIVVLSNHQNGRDTHVRQIKVFGPRTGAVRAIYGFDTMAKDVRSCALIR